MATLKKLKLRADQIKYTGPEPEWETQPVDASDRRIKLGSALDWYNYHFGRADAKEFIIEYLTLTDRVDEAKQYKKAPDGSFVSTYGWLARIVSKGLILEESEEFRLNKHISDVIATGIAKKEEKLEEEGPTQPVITIQDRLRMKMAESLGEIEEALDSFIAGGCKDVPEFVGLFERNEAPPQMVNLVIEEWTQRKEEYALAGSGDDPELAEGYSNFGKIQLRNLIKFADSVIAGASSYAQIKKAARKPRAKKVKTPEQLTRKFKFLDKFAEFNLESIPVTKLVECGEAWLYDTKKRKLIRVLADPMLKTFTVKNNTLAGIDTIKSVQKTLRKPKDQLKEFAKTSVPKARKFFEDIKAVEVKFNGRGNENLIILRAR